MTNTPIFEQLVSDPKFLVSAWPRDDLGTKEQRKALEEPWPDPYVVLPPSPTEAARLVAERAGWDTTELDVRAIRAQALADAERTMQLMTIAIDPEPEPAPEEEPAPEPEPEEEKDNVDEQ